MDRTQLKHRLVGAIVLVALGVIFIPMILTTDDEFNISETNIPAKPAELKQLAEMAMPEPEPVQPNPNLQADLVDAHTPTATAPAVAASDAPAAAQTNNATPDTTVAEQAETLAPQSSSKKPATQNNKLTDRAWIVQVASFSERNKALALRDRLRKAKYPTFVESVSAKNTKLYRVRVGPVVRRENADEWQQKIARDFKVPDALVMAHPG